MCLTALLNGGAKISIKSPFMDIGCFFSVHSAVVNNSE